jgi:hypothetical protein
MKTVKILIATAILSTSFYACKKEEMNIQPGEVTLNSSNQSNISPEGTFDASSGMIKIVFNKVGTMIIEGNPNLEKLISMYDASKTAIASAKEVFETTEQESLSITFDRNGYAVTSDIPEILVGSNIDAFIFEFCKVKPSDPMTLEITKGNIKRNYEEFWNALPVGTNEKFLTEIKKLQEELPIGYNLQLSITENQAPVVIYLDENGDPQPIGNSTNGCSGGGSGYWHDFLCSFENLSQWI